MVVLLHREDAYERESPRAGEADFIVAKHRNGPTSTITVAFQGHYSRFVDMAQTFHLPIVHLVDCPGFQVGLAAESSAVIRWASQRGAPAGSWLAQMLARKPKMLVVVALANKLARTVWALLVKGGTYRTPVPAA